jgi:hypothetical protein
MTLVMSGLAVMSLLWFSFLLGFAVVVYAAGYAKRLVKWNNDRYRRLGDGGCGDCSPDWCPCWEREQEQRHIKLTLADGLKDVERAAQRVKARS